MGSTLLDGLPADSTNTLQPVAGTFLSGEVQLTSSMINTDSYLQIYFEPAHEVIGVSALALSLTQDGFTLSEEATITSDSLANLDLA